MSDLERNKQMVLRLDDAGKIVEHWGVLQAAPDSSANANGMF
jgi:predicted SnoaL-like aldol condensation-catalyzing enzyme